MFSFGTKDVRLRKAGLRDAELLHSMMVRCFQPFLERYEDYDTSPAAEPLEKTVRRLEDPATDYYLVLEGEEPIGGVRTVAIEQGRRVSPIFILPERQGHGVGSRVIELLEERYPEAQRWTLDTIRQETGLVRFYEGLGYRRTGEEIVINEKMTLIDLEKPKEKG